MNGLGITAVLVFGTLQFAFGQQIPVWLWAIGITLAIRELLAYAPKLKR